MSASPRNEDRKPVTLTTLAGMRALGEPIVMVTAYDHPSAQVAEAAGVEEMKFATNREMLDVVRG